MKSQAKFKAVKIQGVEMFVCELDNEVIAIAHSLSGLKSQVLSLINKNSFAA